METFSALLTICAGNSPVPGEFPAQTPVMRSFDVIFDLRPNKRLSKQSWGWWFEKPSRPLWRHCNDYCYYSCVYNEWKPSWMMQGCDGLIWTGPLNWMSYIIMGHSGMFGKAPCGTPRVRPAASFSIKLRLHGTRQAARLRRDSRAAI